MAVPRRLIKGLSIFFLIFAILCYSVDPRFFIVNGLFYSARDSFIVEKLFLYVLGVISSIGFLVALAYLGLTHQKYENRNR